MKQAINPSSKKGTPYGLSEDEMRDIENLFVNPGWHALVKKVYPKIRESLINSLLARDLSNDHVNEIRGELRALNDYINAPLIAFKIKQK